MPMSRSLLDREMYTESEAARLFLVHPSTLHWWLEGRTREDRVYRPVIRHEASGSKILTWGEFVMAGLLRQYRRKHRVPLSELRAVIDQLRAKFDDPYPLIRQDLYVAGRQLLQDVQETVGLPAELCLVAVAHGQLVLTAPVESFLERVEFDGGVAIGWRPHDDPKSTVRIYPGVRFGRPQVDGVSTEVLWEQVEAGASISEVAETFDLRPRDVRWAHSYENSMRDHLNLAA